MPFRIVFRILLFNPSLSFLDLVQIFLLFENTFQNLQIKFKSKDSKPKLYSNISLYFTDLTPF